MMSAKYRAMNILRTLTSDHNPIRSTTTPRAHQERFLADIRRSEEVLEDKYEELAALLINQNAERKDLSRLQASDMGSRYRRKQSHGRTSCTVKSTEFIPCLKNSQDGTRYPRSISEVKSPKKVGFCEGEGDACSIESSDLSDVELIRRILNTPRRSNSTVTVSELKTKRKSPHGKTSHKVTPTRKSSTTSADSKKHDQPLDDKLSSSSSPDVLSWLKAKDKIFRKQRRAEMRKKKKKTQDEERDMEEKIRRSQESKARVSEWVKHKHREELLKQRHEKQARKLDILKLQKPNLGKSQNGYQIKSVIHTRKVSRSTEMFEEQAPRPESTFKPNQPHTSIGSKTNIGDFGVSSSTRAQSAKPISSKLRTQTDDPVDSVDNKGVSNPFKGLTYDQWLNAKQCEEQRTRSERAKRRQASDSKVDSLTRRMQQMKAAAGSVDTRLRRPQIRPQTAKHTPQCSSTASLDVSKSVNRERPATSRPRINQVTHQTSSVSDPAKIVRSMPDLVNFESPEPNNKRPGSCKVNTICRIEKRVGTVNSENIDLDMRRLNDRGDAIFITE